MEAKVIRMGIQMFEEFNKQITYRIVIGGVRATSYVAPFLEISEEDYENTLYSFGAKKHKAIDTIYFEDLDKAKEAYEHFKIMLILIGCEVRWDAGTEYDKRAVIR